jgi:hypothetical protein
MEAWLQSRGVTLIGSRTEGRTRLKAAARLPSAVTSRRLALTDCVSTILQ